jgi:HEAT repeat protein
LWAKYLEEVERRVNTVYILGDSVPHELKDVFVDLTIVSELERPSNITEAQYLAFMNAEMKRIRNPLLGRTNEEAQKPRSNQRNIQPDELLRSNTRVVIAGTPGSGKSTLLRHLTYKTLKAKDNLPVFLELKTIEKAHFDSVQGDIAELLFERVVAKFTCESETDYDLMRKEFYEKLKVGSVSIFLDGLDELSGEEFFSALCRAVQEFLQNSLYQQISIFISARPHVLLGHFGRGELQEMEIAPFNNEQIEIFISHYYGDDPQVSKFISELKRPELSELAVVPALLGFLIILYRRLDSAPEGRLELYRDLVHQLISEWDREKGARREFRTTDTIRKDFLSTLAFARLFSGSRQELSQSLKFTRQEILKEAGLYCKRMNVAPQADLLAEDVLATPLLRQIGTDSYAFAHLTIQEYLAATVLAEHENCVNIFCRKYFDPTVVEMEALPMVLAIAGQQVGLYEVLEQLPDSLDFKKLRLQARSLKYGLAPDPLLSKLVSMLKGMVVGVDIEAGYFDAVVKSFRAALKSASTVLASSVADELGNEESIYREYAVKILGLLDSEAAIQFLHKALKDTDHSVKIRAALYLGLTGNASAVEFLLNELRTEDVNVKEEVVGVLWQIGTEKAIDGLKNATNDDNYFVRRLSLEALAGLCGERAIPILVERLDDPESFVRHAVVTELGEIGGVKVIDPLIKATGDSDSFVVKQAFSYLGEIGGELVYKYLLEYLTSHTGEHIGHAAEALGQLGNREVIPTLIPLLDEYKRDTFEDDEPFFFLTDWSDYVRVRIAAALCQLGEKQGQRALIEALENGIELNYVARALGRTGENEVLTDLMNILERYKGEDGSIAIAEALSNLGVADTNSIIAAMASILAKYKSRSDESRRIRAINVLGQMGGRLAIEVINKALEEAHPSIQFAAILALGNIALEDETAVPGLVNRLGLGVNIVSEEAAKVLARMDDLTLYKGLTLSLRSKVKYVRRKAAQSVAYYPSNSDAIEILSSLAASDPVVRVRNVAHQTLEQLKVKRQFHQE